ncbi:hypothetical protein [Aquipseudomonas alcaligenes]
MSREYELSPLALVNYQTMADCIAALLFPHAEAVIQDLGTQKIA